MMASISIAGLTAHYIQYVLCYVLRGHDVLHFEHTGWYGDPWSASYSDEWNVKPVPDRSYPARRLERLAHRYGLDRQWCWIDIDGTEYGVSGPALTREL